MKKNGLLALEDGTYFWGESVGCEGYFVGEVIFNTSMTGYQEILSDPSYAHQIINFSYPLIGNVGINNEDLESARFWPGGIVVKELSKTYSYWRDAKDLQTTLIEQNIIAISGVDSRKLTRIVREKGALNACIMGGDVDLDFALAKAKLRVNPGKLDESSRISYQTSQTANTEKPFHVVVLDFGVKRSIVQNLMDSGCHLTVVSNPWCAEKVLRLQPHGVLLSNGPGDPQGYECAIEAIKTLLEAKVPLFGICLGHQLLALASNAKTAKMAHGHHGANHPIQDLSSQKVFISSQNHEYVVEETNLPSCLEVTHRSLFDGTIAGLRRKDAPAFSFQGHPEASPGPQELSILFQQFIQLMKTYHA